MSAPLGLVAGSGHLPLEIARAARRAGRAVVAIGFPGISPPALADQVDEIHWLPLGQLEALIACLQRAGATEAVLAGKVSKAHLFDRGAAAVEPDARALGLLARLPDRLDDSILAALAAELTAAGVTLLPQTQWVPELVPGPGVLGKTRPSAAQLEDAAFGWGIAKALAGLDIGQTVVVRDRAVLAVEAIEGTDAAILRAGELAGPGGVVVKVAKPAQDPRFDLPAVGACTLESLVDAGARVLAFEAGATLVLDREELVREADANHIALVALERPARPERPVRVPWESGPTSGGPEAG